MGLADRTHAAIGRSMVSSKRKSGHPATSEDDKGSAQTSSSDNSAADTECAEYNPNEDCTSKDGRAQD
jgi:hypothetical protein